MGKNLKKEGLFLISLIFILPFVSAIICNPDLPNGCPEEQLASSIVINLSGESVNSSNFWDLLNTPNDILSMTNFYNKTDINSICQKYSDFNYVSIQGNELVMEKAGNNYFYLDENVLFTDVNISNGTNNILLSVDTYDWLEDDSGCLTQTGLTICSSFCDLSSFPKNILIVCNMNLNNLTLIFPNKNPTYDNVTALNICNSTICNTTTQILNAINNPNTNYTLINNNINGNVTALSNSTIARIGNCSVGQIVQNITNNGVQCITNPIYINDTWNGNSTNYYNKTNLDNGTWIKTTNINASIDARVYNKSQLENGTWVKIATLENGTYVKNNTSPTFVNLSATILTLGGATRNALYLINGLKSSGSGVRGINLDITNDGFGNNGKGIYVKATQGGGPSPTSISMLELDGSSSAPNSIYGINMSFSGTGSKYPVAINLKNENSGFTSTMYNNTYNGSAAATFGYIMYNDMSSTSNPASSFSSMYGIYNKITDRNNGSGTSIGFYSYVDIINQNDIAGSPIGYGYQADVNGIGNKKNNITAFYGTYRVNNASSKLYGLYLDNDGTTTINNPKENQIGIFVDNDIAGTDANNKMWSFYNNGTNISSKMFLGKDNVPTYMGTNLQTSFVTNSSGLFINTSNLTINNNLGLTRNNKIVNGSTLTIDFLGQTFNFGVTYCWKNFTNGILTGDDC